VHYKNYLSLKEILKLYTILHVLQELFVY